MFYPSVPTTPAERKAEARGFTAQLITAMNVDSKTAADRYQRFDTMRGRSLKRQESVRTAIQPYLGK